MKQLRKLGYVSLVSILFVTLGCTSSHTETESSKNDNETKSMVLDILHTKEGIAALQDIVRDPRLKQSLTITDNDIQQATVSALTDPKSHVQLLDQMKNPHFGEAVAKAYRQDNIVVQKDLMKDPEYQQMMLALLQSPDFQQALFDVMKTPEYRQHAVDIMQQALQNPDFKMQFLQIVKQNIHGGAAGAQTQQKGQQKGSQQSSGQEGDQQKQSKGQSEGGESQS